MQSSRLIRTASLLTLTTAASLGAPPSFPHRSHVATGYAQTNVNAAVFRQASVTSNSTHQFTAYYDQTGTMCLARRELGSDDWTVSRTRYRGNVRDAHNVISIGLDGAGILHVAWDHHGHPLRYATTTSPDTLDVTDKKPMLGTTESNVTYPQFFTLPDGRLLFAYRDGASGNGNLVLNRYDPSSAKWTRLHHNLISGENQRNAYWEACVGDDGSIHLAWNWRETGDVKSNHDLCYAVSNDAGETWTRSDSSPYTLPITASTAEYIARIPQGRELINQTSIAADSEGNPYIATYWRAPKARVPQYRLVYRDNTTNPPQWKTAKVGNRATPFSLSGFGTRRIPISRPQVLVGDPHTPGDSTSRPVYVIVRDEETGSVAQLLTSTTPARDTWTTTPLTPDALGMWEPTFDRDRWRTDRVLNLFVQRTGQGQGETTEALEPQPVSILEWTP